MLDNVATVLDDLNLVKGGLKLKPEDCTEILGLIDETIAIATTGAADAIEHERNMAGDSVAKAVDGLAFALSTGLDKGEEVAVQSKSLTLVVASLSLPSNKSLLAQDFPALSTNA